MFPLERVWGEIRKTLGALERRRMIRKHFGASSLGSILKVPAESLNLHLKLVERIA